MSKLPYPGFPPNYRSVQQTGGYARTCMVVELLSHGVLSSTELAVIQDQLEAALSRLQKGMPNIEKTDVVLQHRFDPALREGLRLSDE